MRACVGLYVVPNTLAWSALSDHTADEDGATFIVRKLMCVIVFVIVCPAMTRRGGRDRRSHPNRHRDQQAFRQPKCDSPEILLGHVS